MAQKLEKFDEARTQIARLQGELDRLRNNVALEVGSNELPEGKFDTLVFRVDEDRLAIALTLNSGVGTPFGDLRIVRMGTAAIQAADDR